MNTRTCVICKKKRDKDKLFRFIVLPLSHDDLTTTSVGQLPSCEIVIDINHKIKSRGFYFCKDNANCEKYLPNWVTAKKGKKNGKK